MEFMNFTGVLSWPRSKLWPSTTMDSKVIKYDGELKVITPFERTCDIVTTNERIIRTSTEVDLATASGSYGLT
jgi:hypothetical protein